MPQGTLCLIALSSRKPIASFIRDLKSSLPADGQPLTIAKVVRWIIVPSKIDAAQLLEPTKPWDLLIILPTADFTMPGPLKANIDASFKLSIGVPLRLTKDFAAKNQSLLHPAQGSPRLTGALDKPVITDSSQDLSLSSELQSWIQSFSKTRAGQNAVSMLNLLAFHPEPEKKKSYQTYGQAFAKNIGADRGGLAKLVGHVLTPAAWEESTYVEIPLGRERARANTTAHTLSVSSSSSPLSSSENTLARPTPNPGPTSLRRKAQSSPSECAVAEKGVKWDEFALAHYPSIVHFADMIASEDYQAVNRKYRLPALMDTCILCTSEIEVEDILHKPDDHCHQHQQQEEKAKL